MRVFEYLDYKNYLLDSRAIQLLDKQSFIKEDDLVARAYLRLIDNIYSYLIILNIFSVF